MAHETLSLSELIPATEEEIYAAWLSSDQHAAFTGEAASIDPVVGGKHSTYSGYAQGAIVDLQPARRIVQTWRTSDFPDGSPDSRLELTLEPTVGGTMLTLLHTEIPGGQSDNYRQGWVKYYFDPLKKYFGNKAGSAVDATAGGEAATSEPAPAKKPAARLTNRAKTANGVVSAKATPKAPAPPAPVADAKPAAVVKPKAKPAVKAKAKAPVKAKTPIKAKPPVKAKAKAKPKAGRTVAAKAKAPVKAKRAAAAAKKKSAGSKAKSARKSGSAKARPKKPR